MTPTPQPADERKALAGKLVLILDEVAHQIEAYDTADLPWDYTADRLADYILANYTPKPVVPADGELGSLGENIDPELARLISACVGAAKKVEADGASYRHMPDWFAAQAAAAQERAVFDAQTNAVAWAVGVLDDLHTNHTLATTLASNEDDKIYKGIKNTLRDRYKAEAGIDPAPNYPVKANLAAHPKQPNDGGDEL